MAQLRYTLVCDFDGGTYLSQIEAINEEAALLSWGDLVECEQTVGQASDAIANLVVEGEQPVPVNEMAGVWCWTTTVHGKLVLIHIIQTA